jgi:arylsulfatase A-like enzyme
MVRNSGARFSLYFFALVAALLLHACGEGATRPRPNIILITIDTLRADHLSCYGYHRETSPFIDSIAREALLFSQAYATSSWTAPSMASIFTGRYPRGHGVRHGSALGPRAAITGQELLVDDFLTIAEALKDAGYTTYGVSSNGHVSRGTGFGQGFDHFATHWFMKSPAPNTSVREWRDAIWESSPFFLWVHYFDPHNPYAPRLPWVRDYTSRSNSYSRWTREPMANPRDYLAEIAGDPLALQTLLDRYDSEINYCDQHIAQLFALLPADPNTLVIITSDHGEAFLEHGQVLHGETLFEEEIRVPLIVKLPRIPGDAVRSETISAPVSNRSIFATIMDVAGLDAAPDPAGSSLIAPGAVPPDATPEPLYLELDWLGKATGLRVGDWKLIIAGNENHETQLFDLEADPGETRNLLRAAPERAAQLNRLLRQWESTHPEFVAPVIEMEVDPERERRLRSLGYL